MKRFLFLMILLFITKLSFAQFYLDTVSVVSTKILNNQFTIKPVFKLNDSLAIINSQNNFFQYFNLSNIDVKFRSNGENINDLSINGATFEQNLVLFDGMRLNDCQTGHFNLDLPMNFFHSSLLTAEIQPGGSFSLYGSNAFGGYLNFQTLEYDENKYDIRFSMGEGNYLSSSLNSFLNISDNNNMLISFVKQKSDGLRENTDFSNISTLIKDRIKFKNGNSHFYFFYFKKDFGANDFYAKFPSYEKTKGIFLANNSNYYIKDNLLFNLKIYYKKHNDTFFLNRFDYSPNAYINRHKTYQYTTELSFSSNNFSTGVFLQKNTINSSNLGDHNRYNYAFFGEYGFVYKKVIMQSGMRYEFYNKNSFLSPQLNLKYFIFNNLSFFLSGGYSYRLPSFTELYYHSPSNLGNSELKPEKAITFESGVTFIKNKVRINFYFFHRNENDLISWIENKELSKWVASNIDNMKIYGENLNISYEFYNRLSLNFSGVFYQYDSSNKKGIVEKYLRPDYKVQAIISKLFGNKINLLYGISYVKNVTYDPYFYSFASIGYQYKKVVFSLEINNIFNTKYDILKYIKGDPRNILFNISFLNF